MRTVVHTLAAKPAAEIHAIAPDESVFEALHRMAENNVGALVVTEGERLVGIVSERDYARKMVLKGRASAATPVSAIMSSPVVTVTPQATAQQCMKLMTRGHLRHLPVGMTAGWSAWSRLATWSRTSSPSSRISSNICSSTFVEDRRRRGAAMHSPHSCIRPRRVARPGRAAYLAVPTLLVAAEHDHGGSPVPAMQEMAAQNPSCRLEVIAGVGNICNHEAPEAVERLLRRFFLDQ